MADGGKKVPRLIRRAEVEQRCGIRRAHLYKLMSEGDFPSNVKMGERAVGWIEDEVEEWIRKQIEKRGDSDINGDERRVLEGVGEESGRGFVKINGVWMTALGLGKHKGETGKIIRPDTDGRPYELIVNGSKFELFDADGPIPRHLIDQLVKERAFLIVKAVHGLSISMAHNAMVVAKEMLENGVTIDVNDVRLVKKQCFLHSVQQS